MGVALLFEETYIADRKIILLMNFVCHIENVLAQISI